MGACLLSVMLGKTRAQATDPLAGQELVQVSDMYIRSKGKFYYEVSYDVGAIAREMSAAEAIVHIGCVTGKIPFGFLGRVIAQEHKQRPVRHVGIAVDFEQQRLALRNNGEWMDGRSFDAGGIAFPGPEVTTCGVMSSESIAALVARPSILQINWGQTAFRFAPPAAFSPYGQGVAY